MSVVAALGLTIILRLHPLAHPASRTASFLYLVPAVAFLVAWAWLGEVPAVFPVVGGFVTLAGVLLANRHAR